MSEHSMQAIPTTLPERIVSLDLLRGFAVLGILIMNISSFSMVSSAYMNPTSWGDFTGANLWIWMLNHILADSKFYTIFSILFGAGIVLMAERMEARGLSPARRVYLRNFWLILFGLLHAYVFWYGDILYAYGMGGLLAYLFRKLRPWTLVGIGLAMVLFCSLFSLFIGLTMDSWPEESVQGIHESWAPSDAKIERELNVYRGSWWQQMELRVPDSIMMQTFAFFLWIGWKIIGLMLIGMALYKWGVLSAARSRLFYFLSVILSFMVGFPLVILGVIHNFSHDWDVSSMFIGSQFNYWGSLPVALGYISLVMMLAKSRTLVNVLSPIRDVGRTAFSNYLLQTIICTTLFYGHGLGLYGHVQRTTQVLLVAAIWVLLIILSRSWLKWFKIGPFEWVWRSLTYRRLLPLR